MDQENLGKKEKKYKDLTPGPTSPSPTISHHEIDIKTEHKSSTIFIDIKHAIEQIAEAPTINDRSDVDVKAFLKNLDTEGSKFVYVCSVISISTLTYFTLGEHWLLPFFYTTMTPVLVFTRLGIYWKKNYQFFLFDYCYFGGIFTYIYIWAYPDSANMFAICFSIANGPLLWSLFIFRNSLVFHSLDKVTSAYIHMMPSLLSYVIRWYPEKTSRHWHKEFPTKTVEDQMVYLVAAPWVFAVCHLIGYTIVVQVILRPSEKYKTLFRHVMDREKTLMYKLCNLLGPKFRYTLYCFWWLLLNFFLTILSTIWYHNYTAHVVVMCIFILICLYNGASYYIDVFRLDKASRQD